MYMRKKLSVLLFLGLAFISLTVYKISYRRTLTNSDHSIHPCDASTSNEKLCPCDQTSSTKVSTPPISPISCHINEDVLKNVGKTNNKSRHLNCLLAGEGKRSEVYVPFSFIKSYFEISGEVRLNQAGSYFSWSHSFSRVFPHLKETRYDPAGPFLQFAGFDVENRPRVKCVTASQGVPLTTQWDRDGYYYPTQICQYALSHWSKYVQEKSDSTRTETIYEDGAEHQGDWQGGDITRVLSQKCVLFESQVNLPLKNKLKEYILSFDLQLRDNVTITVTVKSPQAGRVKIRYVPDSSIDVERTGRVAIFGYGTVTLSKEVFGSNNIQEGKWKRFTRNIANDLAKGLPNKSLGSPLLIEDISFEGVGCVTNLSLASRQSLRFFYHAADWLLIHQDSMGGWPVGVTLNRDNSKYTQAEEIQPGWYSGMGQGHAISVLTRAYRESLNQTYLEAAVNAIKLFKVSSSEGGIVARFMDTSHIWFEEYPTKPSSFILNGFMYSLLGLYDLWSTLQNEVRHEEESKLAEQLFTDGLASLRALLPFFDTGSGSVYDLRHFTMSTAPKIARWDYHSTHINLLYTLATLADDKSKQFFLATADRWLGYMLGNKSKHN